MSRVFNGTSAGISTGFNVNTGQQMSLLVRSNQSVNGGFRTIANTGTQDSNERFILSWGGGNYVEWYVRGGTGWRQVTPWSATAGWKGLLVTFDFADIQTAPRMWTREGPAVTEYTFTKITSGTGVPTDGQTLRLGRTSSGRWITGYMDEFALWTRILAPAEAASVLARGVLPHIRGINLWWNFRADRFLDWSGNARPPTNGGTTYSAAEFAPVTFDAVGVRT